MQLKVFGCVSRNLQHLSTHTWPAWVALSIAFGDLTGVKDSAACDLTGVENFAACDLSDVKDFCLLPLYMLCW